MALIGKKGRSLSWNYRVVHECVPVPTEDSECEDVFTIREVYYDAAGEPEMWTENAMHPQGETVEELRRDLGYMLASLEQPVIEMADLPGAK